MALSRLYYTQANAVLEDVTTALRVAQSIVFSLKSFIKGVKTGTTGTSGTPPVGSVWTVVGSSDGATAGLDGTDRWTNTFDATKLLRAAAASNHSWIVMQSPSTISTLGVPFYLLISLGTNSDARILVRASKTAFTGGSITADPTSVDSTDFSVFNLLADINAQPSRCTYVTDAVGNFFVVWSRNGIGVFHTMIAFQAWTPMVGDAYPFTIIFDSRAAQRGALDSVGAVYSASAANTGEGCAMRSPTGSVINGSGEGTGIMFPQSASWANRTNVNQGTGRHDAVACITYFYQSTGSIGGVRGIIPDWWIANSSKPVGNCEPTVGDTEHMMVGNTYVPNGGVAPTM